MGIKDLIEKYRKAIQYAKDNSYDLDSASWGYEEGCLITYNDVEELLDEIETTKTISGWYSSFFMDVMDGVKPDEAAINNHLI